MRKTRSLLAAAFILGLSAIAPRAEAGCFTIYVQALEGCSSINNFVYSLACGADALVDLAGCVRRGIIGV